MTEVQDLTPRASNRSWEQMKHMWVAKTLGDGNKSRLGIGLLRRCGS